MGAFGFLSLSTIVPRGLRSIIAIAGLSAITAAAQPAERPLLTAPAKITTLHIAPAIVEHLPPVRADVLAREAWHAKLVQTPTPSKGCFKATFPNAEWQSAPCTTALNKPFPPAHGIPADTVGNGSDFSAEVTGNISSAVGSFDGVSGVTSETDSVSGHSNTYTLQVNANFFTTPVCGSRAGCQGWEQFVYSVTSGNAFMQYWLINYGTCPGGWNSYGSDCYKNSAASPTIPTPPITSLGSLKLTGIAGTGGALDTVMLSDGASAYAATGDDGVVGLAQGWTTAEFNIFGDCCLSQANFNSNSTLVVRTTVHNGTMNPPTCIGAGYTGETNNLTFVNNPSVPAGPAPAIVFTESNIAGAAAACATASSYGDTHLTTFTGLLYDFQASGDFLLAQSGPDFLVQTRQASGAPSWPNAAVNKAVGIKMGSTRVTVYIQPTRVEVNGRPVTVDDGKAIELPDGYIKHRGNLYVVGDKIGNGVRATLNSTWIDVFVGIAHPQQSQMQGLLGKTRTLIATRGTIRPPMAFALRTGAVLTKAPSFAELYHSYTDSWRVAPNDSLFVVDASIRPGIPSRPFYAKDLPPADYQHSRAICTAAGITTPALLDACTLDHAVLRDTRVTQVYKLVRQPAAELRLGLRAGQP